MYLYAKAKSSTIFAVAALFLLVTGTRVEGSRKKDGRQTWSYAEVRPGAFMFWWLFYANGTEDYTKLPLVIWLQGGPGASSTGFGNFEEVGPLDVHLNNRTTSWTNHANVLFVDNPVGTGFSYVNDTTLLTRNNSQIASDLLQTTISFLEKVPEFQDVPIHIFSESYGGKMATQFAYKLSKAISSKKIKCNLQSVNLGDSWISPIDSVLTWAPYLYSMSMVDADGFSKVNQSAYQVKAALEKGDFAKAEALWDETESTIVKVTNGVNFYNILQTEVDSVSSLRSHYIGNSNHHPAASLSRAFSRLRAYHADPLYDLMNGPIKEQLRIVPKNVTWGGQSLKVFQALAADFMTPVVPYVERLLNNTPVAVNVYNGQLDLIVDTMGTLKWVERVQWPGSLEWKKAERSPIMLNNSTEAFVKSYKAFAFYWILKAGHMVPADAPNTALEMFLLITKQKQL